MNYNDKKLNNEYYKYVKYKKKYLKLKMNQSGGSITKMPMGKDEFILGFDIPYETIINKYQTDDGKDLFLVKIKLNDDTEKPVLFGLAGISDKSFRGTSTVILEKLGELETKFSELYLLQYASFTGDQNLACSARDEEKEKIKTHYEIKDEEQDEIYKDDSHKVSLYTPELEMNSKIADHIHDLIENNLRLTNVHLLGKCNGAWVVTLLLLKSNIYKGLYLVVPGIAFGVDKLREIENERLEQISFIFGWVSQDAYPFKWGVSNQEKNRYDRMICDIEEEKKITMKYKSYMYNNGQKEDKKLYHEIYPEFIDIIVKTL